MTEGKIEFIFKDKYGYQLRATIEQYNEITQLWEVSDISSFTTTYFKVKKPDNITVTLPASFENTGLDGILIYTVPSGSTLLNQVGWYRMQAVLINATQYLPTSEVGFKLDDSL
jgi:hypothetical protein